MAINFPSTAGQATDGTFTYVAAGITYSWNGESWSAAGSGATATDRTVFSATTGAASGGGSLAYNSNNGVFTLTPPDLSSYLTSTGALNTHTDVNHGTPNNGDYLGWNQSNLRWENFGQGTGSGLDADLLDAQHGGYYTNASNLNAGTVDPARLSGTYNISIDGAAGSLANLANVGDVSNSTPANGMVLRWNGSSWYGANCPGRRFTISTTASGLNPNSYTLVSIGAPATFALLSIETSHAAWVTVYTDTTSRTNDLARGETSDPLPGSGVLAEVITTSATTQKITPGTICFSESGSNQSYLKIYNKTGSQVNLQVTLTVVPLQE